MGTRFDVSAFLENWRNQNCSGKRRLMPAHSLPPYTGTMPPAQAPLPIPTNYVEMAAKQMVISSFSHHVHSVGTFSMFSVQCFLVGEGEGWEHPSSL